MVLNFIFAHNVKVRAILIFIRSLQFGRFIFYRLLSTCYVEGKPKCHQPFFSYGSGRIIFGKQVVIGYFPSPYFFSTYAHIEARGLNSLIKVDSGTMINNNFCAIAEHTSINIGKNCLIGANVEILDSDFHGIKINERNISRPEWARPVNIMDNVFIGSNSRIMKGVTVGRGAVIANSSVVTKDVPAHSIVAGNPARVIKALMVSADD